MEGPVTPVQISPRQKPAHLVCGMPLWGVTGTLVCSYLAWLSYSHVRSGQFDWPHDGWSIASYGVWVLLMAGLISETRCLRERMFFALVMINFAMGFTLASWDKAALSTVREMRVITSMSWALAALISLAITFSGTGQKVQNAK